VSPGTKDVCIEFRRKKLTARPYLERSTWPKKKQEKNGVGRSKFKPSLLSSSKSWIRWTEVKAIKCKLQVQDIGCKLELQLGYLSGIQKRNSYPRSSITSHDKKIVSVGGMIRRVFLLVVLDLLSISIFHVIFEIVAFLPLFRCLATRLLWLARIESPSQRWWGNMGKKKEARGRIRIKRRAELTDPNSNHLFSPAARTASYIEL